jgi:hypothetical protein
LKKQYDAALARLKRSTANLDIHRSPAVEQIEQAERDRLAFERARQALEIHIKAEGHNFS